MRRILALLVLPVLVVPALAGCVFSRGPLVSEERAVDEVSAVVLATSGDLVITIGEPSLTITAPSDVMGELTAESDDDLLVLGKRGPGVVFGEVRYELSMPAIDSVRIAGSGDIDVDFSAANDIHVLIEGSGDIEGTGVDAATVTVGIEGSGDVELAGTADGLIATIDGSGDIDLEDLAVRDARVEIAGAGEIRVHATGTLAAEVSGSGTVRYSGGAEVTSTVSGSGQIVAD